MTENAGTVWRWHPGVGLRFVMTAVFMLVIHGAPDPRAPAEPSKSEANEKLQAEVSELKVTLARSHEESASLKSQLEKEISSLTSQLAAEMNQRSSLTSQLAAEMNQRSNLNSQLAAKQDQISNLTTQLVAEMDQRSSLTSQLAAEKEANMANTKRTSEMGVALKDLMIRNANLSIMYQDPSIQHFLQSKATKVYYHPGIQGAANKTFAYILPSILSSRLAHQQWFKSTVESVQQQIKTSGVYSYVEDDVGAHFLPVVSGFLVYGLLLIPFILTFWCLTSVFSFVCKMRPCLLFCHLYLCIVNGVAGAFAAYTGADPLHVFALREKALYTLAQVFFAGVLCTYWFVILYAWFLASRTWESWWRFAQVLFASMILVAYYLLIWTPAVTDKLPEVHDAVKETWNNDLLHPHPSLLACGPYVLPCLVFYILFFIERATQRRAQVAPTVDGDELLVAIRKMVELRGEEALTNLMGLRDPEGGHKTK